MISSPKSYEQLRTICSEYARDLMNHIGQPKNGRTFMSTSGELVIELFNLSLRPTQYVVKVQCTHIGFVTSVLISTRTWNKVTGHRCVSSRVRIEDSRLFLDELANQKSDGSLEDTKNNFTRLGLCYLPRGIVDGL